MKTCVGSLVALAVLQMVCSTPYHPHRAIAYVEGMEEADSSVDIDDSRYSVMADPDTMGMIKCGEFLCCPKIYRCGAFSNCESMMKIKFSRPMLRCPTGIVEQTGSEKNSSVGLIESLKHEIGSKS